MPVIILIGVALWFIFGSPPVTVANWFWENDAAPWETVDAYYYPDRSDLSKHQAFSGLASVQACRDQVFAMAAINNDPSMVRGSYECGIQKTGEFGTMSVYRATVR